MKVGYIKYNGKTSDDVGLRVEHHPHRIIPARKREIVSVPGRSGDLIFEQDAFENYEQSYDVWIDPRRGYYETAKAAAAWLNGAKGYKRLEDENDADTYRLAYFSGSADFDNRLILLGKATLRFNCKPQRWLKKGEGVVNCFASGVDMVPSIQIENPTQFEALPYIKVYANSESDLLYVNDTPCVLREIDEYIELDCELQNAYKSTQNLNSNVYIPEYPKLKPGLNVIKWSAGSEIKLDIIPRWWTL